mgnify:CR=1 FL=1
MGKSTLFNRLSQERIAVVDSRPGVTRDFLENVVNIKGKRIKLVDTGGRVEKFNKRYGFKNED